MTIRVPPDLDEAKAIARRGSVAQRAALAGRVDLPPELLYFLAQDRDPAVRIAAAGNMRMPHKADLFLAEDDTPEVREAVARKLGQRGGNALAPANRELLQRLARDQMQRVRHAIAETIKSRLDAPYELIASLARDVELMVAQPVLEFSPLLTDADLIEIIGSGIGEGGLTAIARRTHLVGEVTDALVETGNVNAIGQLLRNSRAQIREGTLDRLIDRSCDQQAWQEALVERQGLSRRATLRLATVIADHLLDRLTQRHGVNPDIARELREVVQQRLEDGLVTPFSSGSDQPGGLAERLEQVKAQAEAMQLDDAALFAAIASQDRGFVMCALTALTDVSLAIVIDILRSQNAKAICALVWKAGLGAGVAAEIQTRVCRLQAREVLHPTAAGGYPLSAAAMDWQLELFTGG